MKLSALQNLYMVPIALTVLMLASGKVAMSVAMAATVATTVTTAKALPATSAATTKTPSATTSTTKVARPATPIQASNIRAKLSFTRSTNLIDFQDGTRKDSFDYELAPSMKTSQGTFATSITYSQDLRDQYSGTASDWGDVPIVFAFNPTELSKSPLLPDKSASLSYSISAIIPLSQNSVKKNQLQTALAGKIGLAIMPSDDAGFGYSTSISLARNLHRYEQDTNGAVLNQYSSKQTLDISYLKNQWSFGLSFANRTAWSYQNNAKNSFELGQEIAYSLNKNIAFAIGHTNAGATLKDNGVDYNIELFNENSSTVYATLGLSY